MVWVQNGYEVDEGGTDSDDDENVGDLGGSGAGGEGIAENTCPLQFRDLQVLKLGDCKSYFVSVSSFLYFLVLALAYQFAILYFHFLCVFVFYLQYA